MKKSEQRIVIIGVILLTLVIATIIGLFHISSPKLVIQGEIEATEVKAASKLTGRVKKITVKEGDHVKTGKVLVEIESPEIEAKIIQAKAAKEAAKAQRSKAESGTREEQITTARNMWLKAKAGADLARKTYSRIFKVYKEGVVPAQRLDEVKAKMEVAIQTENAAKANYEMALKGARDEDKKAALALENKAKGAVSEVLAYAKETSIIAPIDGEVASIIAKRGELITQGYPIITLVDLKDAWATFNLREDLLKYVKVGKQFQAKIPAMGEKLYPFKINFIKAMGDFASWTATKTKGEFDMKTFEIRALPLRPIEGLRPGMSVLVEFGQFKQESKQDNK